MSDLKQNFAPFKKIDGSINIEINDLLSNLEYYIGHDKNRLIVTICNAGNQSSQAAIFLKNNTNIIPRF